MKVAVIGSRTLKITNLEKYLPAGITEIVSGGAMGVDRSAKEYALKNDMRMREFFPDYQTYGKVAPLKRNLQIINYSDMVIAFWNGKSRGTKHIIENCKKLNVPVRVVLCTKD